MHPQPMRSVSAWAGDRPGVAGAATVEGAASAAPDGVGVALCEGAGTLAPAAPPGLVAGVEPDPQPARSAATVSTTHRRQAVPERRAGRPGHDEIGRLGIPPRRSAPSEARRARTATFGPSVDLPIRPPGRPGVQCRVALRPASARTGPIDTRRLARGPAPPVSTSSVCVDAQAHPRDPGEKTRCRAERATPAHDMDRFGSGRPRTWLRRGRLRHPLCRCLRSPVRVVALDHPELVVGRDPVHLRPLSVTPSGCRAPPTG
jgi:hypothetical protein